jgi:uncharacterized protein YndB with AHSA1/START domain
MPEPIRQGDIPGVQLRCRQLLPIDTETAWSWLTEPVRLTRWLAASARIDPGPPAILHLETVEEDGTRLRELGTTLDRDRPRLWSLAFQQPDAGWPVATRLTFELLPHGDGCELSVLQEGFEHLPLSDCLTIWEAYRRRWREALGRLAEEVGLGA